MTKTELSYKNSTAKIPVEVVCSVERMEREEWVNCFKRHARDPSEYHQSNTEGKKSNVGIDN